MDTSTDACSVALMSGSRIEERHAVAPRRHRELAVQRIRELLDATDTELHELDALVLGNGPGSFVGLRIAASLTQGLAFSLGIEVAAVSSLAAMAAEAAAGQGVRRVLVAQDARMDQVYVAEFAVAGEGLPELVDEVTLRGIGDALPLCAEDAAVTAGDAWGKYPGLAAALPDGYRRSSVEHPRARWLLDYGAEMLQAGGGVRPDDLGLLYVRNRVAEPSARRRPDFARSGP